MQASDHPTESEGVFGIHRPPPPSFALNVGEGFAPVIIEARTDNTGCWEVSLFEVSKQCVDGWGPCSGVPDNDIAPSEHLITVESTAFRQEFIVSHGSSGCQRN